MINDEVEKCYYFAVKNLLELYSFEWLRSKKAAIINGDNYFQNALNDALNYQKIKKDPQRISKIRPYISQYNWKDIDFPLHQKDWKKFEKNNKTIALNMLFVPYNKETVKLACKLEYNHKHQNQVILLMITDGNKWHYLAARNLSALLRNKTSNHDGDFYCLNCFNYYSTKNRLKEHEELCNKHNSCCIEMPKWVEKIQYNPGEKSLKVPFVIYLDLESLLKKNNLIKIIQKNCTQRKKLA